MKRKGGASYFLGLSAPNLNPFSSDSDQICELIYKRTTDGQGRLLEKYSRVCELIDIDPEDLIYR
jgi:hypothetical protein